VPIPLDSDIAIRIVARYNEAIRKHLSIDKTCEELAAFFDMSIREVTQIIKEYRKIYDEFDIPKRKWCKFNQRMLKSLVEKYMGRKERQEADPAPDSQDGESNMPENNKSEKKKEKEAEPVDEELEDLKKTDETAPEPETKRVEGVEVELSEEKPKDGTEVKVPVKDMRIPPEILVLYNQVKEKTKETKSLEQFITECVDFAAQRKHGIHLAVVHNITGVDKNKAIMLETKLEDKRPGMRRRFDDDQLRDDDRDEFDLDDDLPPLPRRRSFRRDDEEVDPEIQELKRQVQKEKAMLEVQRELAELKRQRMEFARDIGEKENSQITELLRKMDERINQLAEENTRLKEQMMQKELNEKYASIQAQINQMTKVITALANRVTSGKPGSDISSELGEIRAMKDRLNSMISLLRELGVNVSPLTEQPIAGTKGSTKQALRQTVLSNINSMAASLNTIVQDFAQQIILPRLKKDLDLMESRTISSEFPESRSEEEKLQEYIQLAQMLGIQLPPDVDAFTANQIIQAAIQNQTRESVEQVQRPAQTRDASPSPKPQAQLPEMEKPENIKLPDKAEDNTVEQEVVLEELDRKDNVELPPSPKKEVKLDDSKENNIL